MRSILTASLPAKTSQEIRTKAKKLGLSVSAFILAMFEREKELISEDEILQLSQTAKKKHSQGKTKKLNSLTDLM